MYIYDITKLVVLFDFHFNIIKRKIGREKENDRYSNFSLQQYFIIRWTLISYHFEQVFKYILNIHEFHTKINC